MAEDGEWWIVTDEDTGVTTQGPTRVEALENLDEAVAPHKGEIGRPLTDEELREMGIGPDSVLDEPQVPDVPWFDDEQSDSEEDDKSSFLQTAEDVISRRRALFDALHE